MSDWLFPSLGEPVGQRSCWPERLWSSPGCSGVQRSPRRSQGLFVSQFWLLCSLCACVWPLPQAMTALLARVPKSAGVCRSRRWGVGVGLALCVFGLLVIWGQGNAGAYSESSDRWIRLAHGALGSVRWTIRLEAQVPGDPDRRCIEVAATGPAGAGGLWACGTLDPTPIIVAHTNGVGRHAVSALALAFPLRVRAVRLWLGSRRSRTVRLRRVGPRQARLARVRPFNFAARAYLGHFCLRRFATVGRSGEVLDISGKMPCFAG
jgi:hypothetical protein